MFDGYREKIDNIMWYIWGQITCYLINNMSINKETDYGKINITNKAIAGVVADAAMECYGVVGLCRKDSVYEKISVLLKRNDFTSGVNVKIVKNKIEISLYIVVASGVKVTEVLRNVQDKVKYVVEKTLETKVSKVNVYVQDLKKVN